MKKYIIKTGLLMSALFAMSACTGEFLKINTNPYEASEDDLKRDDYIIASVLSAMSSSVISTDINTCQFTDCLLGGPMGGYYSTTGSFSNTIDYFNATDNWTNVFFKSNNVIPVLFTNLKLLEKYTDDPTAHAIAKVIKVASLSRVTDAYGPIIYTENGKGNLQAEYDTQEKVYYTMFEELDEAIKVLTENSSFGISPNADPVFDGSALKWCKFANSLKLRLAMRLTYIPDGELLTKADVRRLAEEAVNHEIGVITSNADNAALQPKAMGEKGNPLYTAVKYNQPADCDTGGDTHVAADIVHYMNGYNDPRRDKYFIKSMFDGVTYAGIRVSVEKPSLTTVSYKYSGVNVRFNDALQWMNAAEVAFLKAEAVAVWGFDMGDTAENLYNRGIELSFEQWGVAGASSYMQDETSKLGAYVDPAGLYSYATPLTGLTVKWDEAATVEQKQERIMIQKWIANFNLGNEAWADHRRTGYPKFFPVHESGNKGIDKVDPVLGARRVPYPLAEYSDNGENVMAAVAQLKGGKDNYNSRMWWDNKEF